MPIFCLRFLPALLLFLALTAPLHAQTSTTPIDHGDTAWLLTSSALVLFMMIPGLALFYAGLVKSRNVLSIFMQCFVLTCALSVLWMVCGYSLAFTDGGTLVGGTSRLFFQGISVDSVRSGLVAGPTGPVMASQTVPEIVFALFQMMFFMITPGLFIGAFAERMKFSAILIFSLLWSLLVYVPVCYGVWHNGPGKLAGSFFGLTDVIDLAGGVVVHITAGIAALVACIMVGPRKGFPTMPFLPHNLPFTIVGAGMLWVGWFGFNGGSQTAAKGAAGMTIVVTHLSASAAALTWMAIEWFKNGKPSALGIATGSIAGLAAVTPAAGYVAPAGALAIGTISAALCWFCCSKLKHRFRYDDSLDVFGVHGIGGIVGTVLVAVFGSSSLGGFGQFDIGAQLVTQGLAAVYTAGLSGVVTWGLLSVLRRTIGLRVDEAAETEGLDISEHGETGYSVQ